MRQWNQKLFDEYFPRVRELSAEDRAIALEGAQWVREQWSAQGFSSLIQQKTLLQEFRKALKAQLPEGHIALETMTFSTEEWIAVNRASVQRTALQNQEQRILDPGTVNAIVTRATQLLLSREWSDIAAGLAVVTGRRAVEVVKTATFTPKSAFSVLFIGALKRKGGMKMLEFEIPTLCPADDVLTAWTKLRRIKPTQHLSVAQCNQFSNAVATACDRHFSGLVDPPVGRETLYTHLFRKIYATIATYFYCPPTVDEAEYRAHIQGHFSGHDNLTLAERRSIASDRHYRAYAIADEQGLSRKGIRLGWRDVVVLEEFAIAPKGDDDKAMEDGGPELEPEPEPALKAGSKPGLETNPKTNPKTGPEMEMTPKTDGGETADTEQHQQENRMAQRQRTTLPIWHDQKRRWTAVLDAIAPTDSSEGRKEDRLDVLLDWIEERLDDQRHDRDPNHSGQMPPSQDIAAILAQQSQAIALLSAKVGGENPELTDHIERLESDNQQLVLERDQALSVLEQVRLLVNNQLDESEETQPNPPEPDASDDPRSDASNRNGTEAQGDQPSSAPNAQTPEPAAQDSSPDPEPTAPLDPDIVSGVKAIMAYNDQAQDHNQRWCISFPVMQELMKTVGKGTLPKIKDVFDAMRHEIDQHHQQHGIGKRHNRCHTDESITQFVSLDA